MQKGITLKKTKASYTIAESIGCEEFLNIIDVLKKQYFCVLLDKSADICMTQTLALVVRYLNADAMQTIDWYLDVIEVVDGTSMGLFKSVS